MSSRPDPTLMSEFCHQLLPALLTEGCEVPDNAAQEVARDALARAEAIASLEQEHIGAATTRSRSCTPTRSSRATTSSKRWTTPAPSSTRRRSSPLAPGEPNQPYSSDKAHDQVDEPFAVLLDQNVPDQNVPVEVGLAGKSDTASRFMAL